MNSQLKLQANNSEEVLTIDPKAALRSELINDLKADFGEGETILIQEANYNALKLIIEYLNHYTNKNPIKIESPIPDDKEMKDITDSWDIQFLSKMDMNIITDVISAAEFMRIEPLHKLISAHIACMIRNLDAQGIVKFFNIQEDMTQEEMDKLEEEDNELLMKELAEEEEKEKKKWELENKV